MIDVRNAPSSSADFVHELIEEGMKEWDEFLDHFDFVAQQRAFADEFMRVELSALLRLGEQEQAIDKETAGEPLGGDIMDFSDSIPMDQGEQQRGRQEKRLERESLRQQQRPPVLNQEVQQPIQAAGENNQRKSATFSDI